MTYDDIKRRYDNKGANGLYHGDVVWLVEQHASLVAENTRLRAEVAALSSPPLKEAEETVRELLKESEYQRDIERNGELANLLRRSATQVEILSGAYATACRDRDEGQDKEREAIDSILNPPPEMEEVEVRAYGVFNKDFTACFSCSTDKASLCAPAGVETVTVDFVQKVQRPKPQPVEKSVSVDCRINSCGDTAGIKTANPFKDYPECHHKRGTLTFTWTDLDEIAEGSWAHIPGRTHVKQS